MFNVVLAMCIWSTRVAQYIARKVCTYDRYFVILANC